MAEIDLAAALKLRGVLRAESYVATVPAADVASGTLDPYRVRIMANQSNVSDAFVVVTLIQTQGIKPSNMRIDAWDINRGPFRLQLTPDLVVPDVPLFGYGAEGVRIEFRNATARDTEVLIHAALINEREASRLLGELDALQRVGVPAVGRS